MREIEIQTFLILASLCTMEEWEDEEIGNLNIPILAFLCTIEEWEDEGNRNLNIPKY